MPDQSASAHLAHAATILPVRPALGPACFLCPASPTAPGQHIPLSTTYPYGCTSRAPTSLGAVRQCPHPIRLSTARGTVNIAPSVTTTNYARLDCVRCAVFGDRHDHTNECNADDPRLGFNRSCQPASLRIFRALPSAPEHSPSVTSCTVSYDTYEMVCLLKLMQLHRPSPLFLRRGMSEV